LVTLAPVSPPATLEFSHRADYGGGNSDRPVIEVEFAATSSEGVLLGALRTGVLVDSGASATLLGFKDAIQLGLDLSDPIYPEEDISGVVPGHGLPAKIAPVKANLCGVWTDLEVRFSTGMWPIRPVLGRQGFFDRMLVGFAHDRREVFASR
jgi:hypothetical protein